MLQCYILRNSLLSITIAIWDNHSAFKHKLSYMLLLYSQTVLLSFISNTNWQTRALFPGTETNFSFPAICSLNSSYTNEEKASFDLLLRWLSCKEMLMVVILLLKCTIQSHYNWTNSKLCFIFDYSLPFCFHYCTHTHTPTHTHTQICTCTHAHMHAHIYTHIHTHMCTHTHTHTHTHTASKPTNTKHGKQYYATQLASVAEINTKHFTSLLQ